MSAIIKLDPDGTVELLSGLNDTGGWQKTTMAMIAAEELGVPYDAVAGDNRRYGCDNRHRCPRRKPWNDQRRPCGHRCCQGCKKSTAGACS